ncbi:ABC transporter permease [Pseudofrankia asymbiotica]|uniref:ABC transporter permease n=1 Tax=Pseudofrankia asymbiotica TaxID=1834516 RepID=A0A1V2I8C6_9ACTN|nr:ABC transporter permease [Pseudofrankia asymbiotica]ONH26965.1 ABC transporter permease [Pseudofrankia asymbiotica]
MRCVLRAEWTKLRTSPGTCALLVGVVAGTVAVSAAAAGFSDPLPGADLPRLSLTGVQLGQAIVAVLAVLAIGDEYASGMTAVTFTAMPRRSRVLAAKALVVAMVVAVVATAAVAASVVVGRLLLPTYTLAARPAIGSVLYLVLIALLSLGIATGVRSPAAGIGVVLALLYALPIVNAAVADPAWQRRLLRIEPASAGLAVQATSGDVAIGPWKGLGVLALWAAGALLAAAVLLERRDA